MLWGKSAPPAAPPCGSPDPTGVKLGAVAQTWLPGSPVTIRRGVGLGWVSCATLRATGGSGPATTRLRAVWADGCRGAAQVLGGSLHLQLELDAASPSGTGQCGCEIAAVGRGGLRLTVEQKRAGVWCGSRARRPRRGRSEVRAAAVRGAVCGAAGWGARPCGFRRNLGSKIINNENYSYAFD